MLSACRGIDRQPQYVGNKKARFVISVEDAANLIAEAEAIIDQLGGP